MKEIFLIVCYKDNRESKYKERNYFEKVRFYISKFKMKDIILIGDLNGRIGNENDNEDINLELRNLSDIATNTQGKEIIEFCEETSLIIANGRLEPGKPTYATLHDNKVRKSVIDYLLVSKSLFHCVKKFEILEPTLYTDHMPFKFELELEMKGTIENGRRFNNKLTKKSHQSRKRANNIPYKWTDKNDKEFNKELYEAKCQELLRETTTKT